MASLVALLVKCCRVVGLITCWSCWETGGACSFAIVEYDTHRSQPAGLFRGFSKTT